MAQAPNGQERFTEPSYNGYNDEIAGFAKHGYNAPVKRIDHKRLQRLERIWLRDPVYFITACTRDRRRLLADPSAHAICIEVWETGQKLHGWQVGRYVVMPDHIHFFCAPKPEAQSLETFVGKWKEWTAKFLHRRLGMAVPVWQEGFFDHLLRSQESYTQKWDYVRQNPVRAGLVARTEDWSFQGCLSDLRMGEMEVL